jgi:hypothetical protein
MQNWTCLATNGTVYMLTLSNIKYTKVTCKYRVYKMSFTIQNFQYLRSDFMKFVQRPWESNSRSIKKFIVFYGNLRFTTELLKPATGPYPEPDESSSHLPTLFP